MRFAKCCAVLAVCALFASSAFAAGYADIIVVVDESGSMGGEHAWIGGAIQALEASLVANAVGSGVDPNQYALIGFGSASVAPRKLLLNGNDWGSATDFAAATGGLLTNGGTEDGYAGIDFAFNQYAYRANSSVNVILITDEDRDNTNAALTYASTLASLTAADAILNVVVDATLTNNISQGVGLSDDGTLYVADGLGGYTEEAGGFVSGAYVNTEADYIDLAHATNGAAWNLNLLRAGGLTADSFTAAFVDIKTEEIIIDIIPEPMTMMALSAGLAALGGYIRRRR